MKVKKLEHKVKSSKARRRVRLVISDDEDNQEDPSKQGRKIAQIDEDERITLVQMSAQNQGRHEHDFKESDFEFIASEEDYTTVPLDISTAKLPLQQLKKLSFDEIKELFETTMKRVNTFTPLESDDTVPKVVVGSSKRDVEQELNQEIPEEEMNVEALQTKYPIIDWEVYTEDSRMYWKIIRVANHAELMKDSTQQITEDIERELCGRGEEVVWKPRMMILYGNITLQVDEYLVMENELLRKIFILAKQTKTIKCLEASSQHRWFNSEKLVDLNNNHKFRGGLLGIKGALGAPALALVSTVL
ncbi:hypothetical protein Tco_1103300 [Tanacetum coccineum]